MYLKDYRIIYTLLFFFSVGTADEILSFFGYAHGITSIIYIGLMLYTLFNYMRFTEDGYLWEGAFPIIGLFALVQFFCSLFNLYPDAFSKIDSLVSVVVWVKCVNYLDIYKKNKEDESF